MLWCTLEALAQNRVLCGNADRASVEMALAHHDAAGCNQRSSRETELVGTKQRTDDHVATRTKTAIDLKRDARTKAVEHQCLVGFGKADFPWRTGMLERGQRRRTRTAIITRNGDVVGARLSNTGGNGTNAHFRHQLDGNIGNRIDVLQIVDELRQIFDRIDVVVWRR